MSPVVITIIIVLLLLAAFVARALLKRQPPRITAYRGERVDDLPDVLKSGTVYLAGDEGHLWAAAMACPCGCRERIELNLLPQARPCWTAQRHADGTVTLMPSVWRQKGCKSLVFVRNGRIDWC